MVLRICMSLLLGLLSIHASKAQLSKRDSIRLKQLLESDEEIKLNPEAVKNIQFNFAPNINEMQKPKMVEDKPWMEFDQSLPKSFNDTTTFRKRKFIRLLPYTVYTKWNEDPVNDKFITSRTDTMTIRMKMDIEKIKPLPGMEHGYRVVPGGMDQSVTPSNNPIVGFDADKALFEIFTKRGRAIRRNRKKAKAWKIYKDYVPTKEDSLKWFGNKKRIPKDTLVIEKDSLFHKDEINRQNETDESGQMVPMQRFPLEEYRSKDGKDD